MPAIKKNKYLKIYAEHETSLLKAFPSEHQFSNCMVIPAYNESDNFLKSIINSPLAEESVLLILVLNQPSSALDNSKQVALVQLINSLGHCLYEKENLTLFSIEQKSFQILLVDRFSETAIKNKAQCVGLARKTGSDIAAYLIQQNLITSPWICSTDADVMLPDNYFTALKKIPDNTSAIVYDFNHLDQGDEISKATRLYEQAIRYYVSGLKWAGSPYAFQTIGSVLALHYKHYMNVRGFPKKEAAEDFYLLNKLNKEAPVRQLHTATLIIKSRISKRVPFGTGPAVAKILELKQCQKTYCYYNPQLFIELKNTLNAMNNLWDEHSDFEQFSSKLSLASRAALEALNIKKFIKHLSSQCKTRTQFNKQLLNWFDGFKTLKFLHHLQQHFYPPMPLYKAREYAPFKIE